MNLRQQFAKIKSKFFPKWDRQGIWKVSSKSKRNFLGYCDPERRIIEIVIQNQDSDESDKLIIHEICHAVADTGHGKKWQERMEKAAKRAEELGRQYHGQPEAKQIRRKRGLNLVVCFLSG